MSSEVRSAIASLLQNDATLTNMLASNKNWLKGGTPDKKWSIVPLEKVSEKMNVPFITIQASSSNQSGHKLVEDFFYLRCYNGLDKTYVTIDDVLSRVKVLLHRHSFAFAG